jgi:hypothetical protein
MTQGLCAMRHTSLKFISSLLSGLRMQIALRPNVMHLRRLSA